MMLSNILDSTGTQRRKVPVHLDIDAPYPSWSTPSPSSSIVSNGTTEDSSSGDEFVPHRPSTLAPAAKPAKKTKPRTKGSEQSNKEFRREYKKEWYEKNREKALAKMKEYYERRKQAGTLHRRTNKNKKTTMSVESSPASSCADEPMVSPSNNISRPVLPRQSTMPALFIHEDMPQYSPSTTPLRPPTRFGMYDHAPQFAPLNPGYHQPFLSHQETQLEYNNYSRQQPPQQSYQNNNHLNLLCHVALME